jgi:hypothetical protein
VVWVKNNREVVRGEEMSSKQNMPSEKKKNTAKESRENQKSTRHVTENIKESGKLNELQTKPLSSRGKKQRQKSKLAPRG